MTKVTIQDVRACSYCARGARLFAARHGIDWTDFLANGVDAERLRASGDAMVLPLIEAAEERERNGR